MSETTTLAEMTLSDLLAIVEVATEPSREIDKALWYKLIFDPELAKNNMDWISTPGIGHSAPAFTASLDQAFDLCHRLLPKWMKFIGDLDPSDMRACATLSQERPPTLPFRGFAPKGQYALATIHALLKAVIANPD